MKNELTRMAELRDYFSIPKAGSELELLWANAMSHPECIPAYVLGCVADKDAEIAALRKDAERLDWLANNPVEALDIFGHTRPGEAREVRIDIDKGIAQAAKS